MYLVSTQDTLNDDGEQVVSSTRVTIVHPDGPYLVHINRIGLDTGAPAADATVGGGFFAPSRLSVIVDPSLLV